MSMCLMRENDENVTIFSKRPANKGSVLVVMMAMMKAGNLQ